MVKALILMFAAAASPAMAAEVIVFETPSETLSIGSGDIAKAEPVQMTGKKFAAEFRLKPGPARAFGLLTKHALKQQLAVIYCKRLMFAPKVEATITSGIIQLPAATLEEAIGMVKVLSGEAACPGG